MKNSGAERLIRGLEFEFRFIEIIEMCIFPALVPVVARVLTVICEATDSLNTLSLCIAAPPHFTVYTLCYLLFTQLRTAPLKLIVRSELDVPNFATRRLHACRHARAPSGGRWNCERKMSGNFA
jgi:hypothetical protein